MLLAGSNFFAPIIAGFIADGQGWQWVLYWCAIFCGVGFIFLFFFMEETNYSRAVLLGYENEPVASNASTPVEASVGEKTAISQDVEPTQSRTMTSSKGKSYSDKIKIFRSYDFFKPNHLAGMVSRPLIFLTFPVIAYAGFSYGSNLVWFNVLNGTASLILGSPPYNFPAWAVGLS